MEQNIVKALPDWPAVIVAGAFQTGVVLMRNLSRRGLRVMCFDCNPDYPGFQTIYGPAVLCPNPDDHFPEWLAFMKELSSQFSDRPVLISSNDRFAAAIGKNPDELSKYFRFCSSAAAVQGLLSSKEQQYELAARHGLPVPRSRFVDKSEDVAAFAAEAKYPCLLKPLHERDWAAAGPGHPLHAVKLILAYTTDELFAHYRLAAALHPSMIVQEIIEGPDTAKLCYMACYDSTGRRLGYSTVRQWRTTPIHFGSASVVEPFPDPEAAALCDGFLRGIGYAGICEIELKRDSQDGQVKMIETNPRYSVTADAAPYAGVDLGWLHYLDLIGQPVTPVEPTNFNFRHIVLQRDLATVRAYRAAGLITWKEVFASYRRPVYFFDFDLRDWRVTAASVNQMVRILLVPIWRRWFPKRAPA